MMLGGYFFGVVRGRAQIREWTDGSLYKLLKTNGICHICNSFTDSFSHMSPKTPSVSGIGLRWSPEIRYLFCLSWTFQRHHGLLQDTCY
jgi:hypothetical protein